MKPADVATRLGVSVTTVYNLIRSGRLASVIALEKGTASPKTMVPEDAVVAWEQRGASTP